jgi:glyoxylase-like metal-dependent hydrolase (beta-lactamase superfamily II)
MNITRISPNAHQLSRLGLVNCYLVQETDGFTLIDTMISGSAPKIIEAAGALSAGPIRRLLLTHAHADHIGSLDALATSIGGGAGSPPSIAISQRESLMLPKPPLQNLNPLPGEPGKAGMKMNFPGVKTPASHLLNEGELFGSLRCIPTPGHTPGHFSFLDERDGTLYAGDALITVGGAPHIPGFGPWYFPFPRFATWDRPTSVASIRNLLETPIARIAPGHGNVLEGGRNLIESALQEANS